MFFARRERKQNKAGVVKEKSAPFLPPSVSTLYFEPTHLSGCSCTSSSRKRTYRDPSADSAPTHRLSEVRQQTI